MTKIISVLRYVLKNYYFPSKLNQLSKTGKVFILHNFSTKLHFKRMGLQINGNSKIKLYFNFTGQFFNNVVISV